MLQVRQLLAAAVATNRTVVMPKLQCYCDRYWGPLHRCRLPGASKLQLPFICPLDHIFEPYNFDDHPREHGPALVYREHSFFENERTPDSIRNGAYAAFPFKVLFMRANLVHVGACLLLLALSGWHCH